jgi:hypothetical protein
MRKLAYIVWFWFTSLDKYQFWLDRADAARDHELRDWCIKQFMKVGVNY